MNRRGFLSLFCAAPFAAPALAKEAMAPYASGGYVRGISGAITARPFTIESVKGLSLKLDTSALDAAMGELKAMQLTPDPNSASGFSLRSETYPQPRMARGVTPNPKLNVGEITADKLEIHDSALIAPNRLKGSIINQDGDAT